MGIKWILVKIEFSTNHLIGLILIMIVIEYIHIKEEMN